MQSIALFGDSHSRNGSLRFTSRLFRFPNDSPLDSRESNCSSKLQLTLFQWNHFVAAPRGCKTAPNHITRIHQSPPLKNSVNLTVIETAIKKSLVCAPRTKVLDDASSQFRCLVPATLQCHLQSILTLPRVRAPSCNLVLYVQVEVHTSKYIIPDHYVQLVRGFLLVMTLYSRYYC